MQNDAKERERFFRYIVASLFSWWYMVQRGAGRILLFHLEYILFLMWVRLRTEKLSQREGSSMIDVDTKKYHIPHILRY